MTGYRSFLFLLCLVVGCPSLASAADAPGNPHRIITDLRHGISVIGAGGGRHADFVVAEELAAEAMQAVVAAGDPDLLVGTDRNGQTPLNAAAQMGYALLVDELLASSHVREAIDARDRHGMTAWVGANFALRQAMLVCNPGVRRIRPLLVPLMAAQPYYLLSPENPYRKTRRLLEEAGATADMDHARRLWFDTCRYQDESVRSRVREADDLLDVVLAENARVIGRVMAEALLRPGAR